LYARSWVSRRETLTKLNVALVTVTEVNDTLLVVKAPQGGESPWADDHF
jgi:hypothetical protein